MATAMSNTDPQLPNHINTISCQSAFWALVPLAMNSMTQSAGMVCFEPSKYGPVLRCLPFICVFDSVFVLYKWITLSISTRSPIIGAKRCLDFRFQDTNEEEAETSFAALQRNTIFRLAMFFMGVLPQFIKLCAMKGVIWLQIAGASYLCAFLVVELVTFLARFQDRRTSLPPYVPSKSSPNEAMAGSFTIVSSIAIALYIYAIGFSGFTRPIIEILLQKNIGRLSFIYGTIITTIISVIMSNHLKKERDGMLFCVVVFSPRFFGSSYAAFSRSAVEDMKTLLADMIMRRDWIALAAVAWTQFALLMAGNTGYILLRQSRPKISTFLQILIRSLYIILHVVSAVLYFGFAYDPAGTEMPSWLSILG